MPGVQRQPLPKHNTPSSTPDILVRNGSSFKMSATNAALWEPTDSLSALRCGRPSQNCQTPSPKRGIPAHIAAWQKQHPLSACAANGSGSLEALPLPSRQSSARGPACKRELRPSSRVSTGSLPSCVRCQYSVSVNLPSHLMYSHRRAAPCCIFSCRVSPSVV